MVRLAAVHTPTPAFLGWARLILQLDGEMLQWKGNYDRGATTRPSTTAILANQLGRQIQTKVLDYSGCGLRTIVIVKNVGISYCHIKKEVEHVFVNFLLLERQL